MMTGTRRSGRVEQALREVGRTRISRTAAVTLALVFTLSVAVPSTVQMALDLARERGLLPAATALVEGGRDAARRLGADGLFAGNRTFLDSMETFEDRLEDESFLRSRFLPPTQLAMSALLGLGNEEVERGADGWLFYRPDVDYTTGRGFLEQAVLRRRYKEEGVGADPVAALTDFGRQLQERDVRLLVVPVPLKPVVVPGPLVPRVRAPIHNPSYDDFLARLRERGVDVFDPTDALLEVASAGSPAFLRADTHWTPWGMERVAEAVAQRLEDSASVLGLGSAGARFFRREAALLGRGDLLRMLALPEAQGLFPSETVRVQLVLTPEGRPWKPDPQAEILVLGDSFTNVYSQPGLGWGVGAGFAEQLSYFLGRPVDRLARNAGGAHQTREALARELAAGTDRLAGKRVVVYEFAARELTSGNWKLIDLGG